jgi:hypothetical protein
VILFENHLQAIAEFKYHAFRSPFHSLWVRQVAR